MHIALVRCRPMEPTSGRGGGWVCVEGGGVQMCGGVVVVRRVALTNMERVCKCKSRSAEVVVDLKVVDSLSHATHNRTIREAKVCGSKR